MIANPIPAAHALDRERIDAAIDAALDAAARSGVTGKALTPFLLDRLAEITSGESLAANAALLENNAALAGAIAVALNDL